MNSRQVEEIKRLRQIRYVNEQDPLVTKAKLYPEKEAYYIAEALKVRAKIKAELPIENEDKINSFIE